MAQRSVFCSAVRGLKLFPSTAHGVSLAGYDCGDSQNNKKKQISDIKKLCANALALSESPLWYSQSLKPCFEQIPSANARICAFVDGLNPLRCDVLTIPVRSDERRSASALEKPFTISQYVQTDTTLIQASDMKKLVDELR
ncbi:unnamed protein product [Gongylonema pulchrum]|uniref:NADH dehydrogenase [ubiquinone] 1 alpha subcomplex assembly factor 3 n=1 Tax=Gongylonema pulchrum TaxID=637853 RepID=A0A183DS76_9BILA|nr:unnamed protein product [Gongylonema pulchrum]